MKRLFFVLIVLMVSISGLAPSKGFAQQVCSAKHILKLTNQFVRPPFIYDSHSANEFVMDDIEKQFEIQFTAFRGQKYKILFTTSGFEEDIQLNIYDKKPNAKNRNTILKSSEKIENSYWLFEPEKPGKYYIEYKIPKSNSGESKKGCILMLTSYTEK